jgi:GcrA cell cycle regulator
MQSNWEEAHSTALRDYVEKGMTFSEIARALNERFGTAYSRNAAIGRARRMGLASPERAGGEKRPNAAKQPDMRWLRQLHAKSRAKIQTKSPTKSPTKSLAGPVPSSIPKPLVKRSTFERAAELQLRCVAITPKHLALIDLEEGDCRYPYGGDADNEPITFCGHPRREGSSYCTSHFHLTSAVELRERIPLKATLRLVEAA